MLGIALHEGNGEIRRPFKVTYVLKRICQLRLGWDRCKARTTDNRQTRRLIEWLQTRWSGDIKGQVEVMMMKTTIKFKNYGLRFIVLEKGRNSLQKLRRWLFLVSNKISLVCKYSSTQVDSDALTRLNPGQYKCVVQKMYLFDINPALFKPALFFNNALCMRADITSIIQNIHR